jgi:hypothetical protein
MAGNELRCGYFPVRSTSSSNRALFRLQTKLWRTARHELLTASLRRRGVLHGTTEVTKTCPYFRMTSPRDALMLMEKQWYSVLANYRPIVICCTVVIRGIVSPSMLHSLLWSCGRWIYSRGGLSFGAGCGCYGYIKGISNLEMKFCYLTTPSLHSYGLSSCLDAAHCRLKCSGTLLPLSLSRRSA